MKLNLDNLKKEIEKKKMDIENTNNKLGFESNPHGTKRRFLSGLIEARNNMTTNQETEHLRKVNNVVDATLPIESIKSHLNMPTKTQQRSIILEDERIVNDSQSLNNIKNAFRGVNKEQGLLESIESFNQTPTQYQHSYNQPPQNSQYNGDINELIKLHIQNAMVDEIKNAVVDMFFFDKIRKSLVENEDVIKEIVIDVIRSLKKKK